MGLNIIIIPSFIYSRHDPTLGSFVFEQAKALVRQGHRVAMLFCDTYSVKYISYFVRYEEVCEVKDGIEVYRQKAFCPLKHSDGFYGCEEIFSKKIIELYYRYLKDFHPDIIHAHCCVWAGVAAYKLSKEISVPYVITEHSTGYVLCNKKYEGIYQNKMKHAFSNAGKVICVSQALLAVIEKYTHNCIVLGNVIDCDLFKPIEKSRQDNQTIFLTVCYMKSLSQIKKKGIDILIDSYAKVLHKRPNCILRIGGAGKAVEIVKQWAKEKQIESHIQFLGELSREEVAMNMSECDVFVLPSRYETFGVVYAEAMSCGKPVIGTKTGGPDSFVTDDCGKLIDVENAQQLEEAMCYIVDNLCKYDSDGIRHNIVNNFSMEAVGKKLEKIYIEVIQQLC